MKQDHPGEFDQCWLNKCATQLNELKSTAQKKTWSEGIEGDWNILKPHDHLQNINISKASAISSSRGAREKRCSARCSISSSRSWPNFAGTSARRTGALQETTWKSIRFPWFPLKMIYKWWMFMVFINFLYLWWFTWWYPNISHGWSSSCPSYVMKAKTSLEQGNWW